MSPPPRRLAPQLRRGGGRGRLCGLGEDTHRFSMEKVMPRIARVRSTQALIEALPIRC
ncbi:hypothetical protein QNM99_29095 [Pseudomonas sp. PCH446]